MFDLRMTYIGGPTALLEWGGLRLLTDPTFDAGGQTYGTGAHTLHKTTGPAFDAGAVGPLDAVLLSHDHHSDNLDAAGRALVARTSPVFTTTAAAARLGTGAVGLEPWMTSDLEAASGRVLRVMATPARHGPAHLDRGPVIGFVLSFLDDPAGAVYVSGDTVWYEGVQQVAARVTPAVAVLFLGAARVASVGDWNLTFTAAEAVEAARAFPSATIVPLHFEAWEHFSESRATVAGAFAAAGMDDRLQWLERGQPTSIRRQASSQRSRG